MEIKKETKIKGIQIGKEKLKFSLFADLMTLYIESYNDTMRKWLELINEFSKVAGYKINTQKSLAFLYSNNEKSEREIKESIPFTTATITKMYLRINLPKETKDPENYKTMIKTKQTNKQKIKDDIDEERYIVFLYQKTRYCENDSTMQSNLQILCNPYEINNGTFCRTRTKKFTMCM